MFIEYIYMNSTTPKQHAETLQNWNISFQLRKQNTYRNGIDNLVLDIMDKECYCLLLVYYLVSFKF
jgi:hypothetical protein